MTTRHIKLYAFCSVKGGVGKSTLAVVTAKRLASRGRVPVLLDVDLTGTSLADGLALCAPRVTLRADGSMDLDAPPTGEILSRKETNHLRNRRKVTKIAEPPPPPYFNDALLYQVATPPRDCRVDAMLWRHEQPDGVLYWPSSPLRKDVEDNSMMLRGDDHFRWVRRFAWILDALFTQRADITDVVMDLPPGIVGFTYELMVFLATLAANGPMPEAFPDLAMAGGTGVVKVFMVTTQDWNDLLPAIEYIPSSALDWPSLDLQVVVNRTSVHALRDLQEEIRRRIDPELAPLGLETKLEVIQEGGVFREIFRRGNIELTSETRDIEKLLGTEEP